MEAQLRFTFGVKRGLNLDRWVKIHTDGERKGADCNSSNIL